MELVQEFAAAAAAGDTETGALLIAGHALCSDRVRHGLVAPGQPSATAVRSIVEDGRQDLDRLAAGVPEPGVASLMRFLFGPEGFTGNSGDYYNPANSILPLVIRSRMGNPITLSVLAMLVGNRVGVTLHGVGMPGHFILRTNGSSPTWIDPFGGGTMMNALEAQALCERVTGGRVAFEASHLDAVEPQQILARMLGNLQNRYASDEAHHHLAWVGQLSAPLGAIRPGTAAAIAGHLARTGRYDHAASVYDAAAQFETGTGRDKLTAKADELWSRLN